MTKYLSIYEPTNTLLSLRNDAVLKLYFANKSNRPQLRAFLKATTHLTDDDLAIIEVHNAILTKEHVQEKDFIVDIHLTSTTGHKIIIEMQIQKHDHFIERMVSYNARRYSTQLNRGEKYTQLKESISLIIVDFPIFDDTSTCYEHILFRRKNGRVFTKAQQFYIIDLTKLPNDLTEDMHKWGALLKAKTEEELRMLMEQSDEMREAGEKLIELSADENAREIADAREYSRLAFEGELFAREERGRKEKAIEMATSLLKSGMPTEEVAKHSKLPLEEIKQLTQ